MNETPATPKPRPCGPTWAQWEGGGGWAVISVKTAASEQSQRQSAAASENAPHVLLAYLVLHLPAQNLLHLLASPLWKDHPFNALLFMFINKHV